MSKDANVCSIPLHPTKIVGVNEYQREIVLARNKGERLRVALRVLSSLGYHAGGSDDLRKVVDQYLEDYTQ